MTQPADQLFGLPDDICKVFNGAAPKAERVVGLLNYKKKDVAAATGMSESSIRYDGRMPEELRQRIMEWAVAMNLVANFFGNEEKALLWFQVPNPLLGGISPRDMIRAGRFKKLLNTIQTALGENRRVERR